MPVTKKPVPKAFEGGSLPHGGGVDEAKVRAVIERGGSIAGERADERARKLLQLRLSVALIARIDGALRRRTVPPSRHHWILEAIHEKLAREEGDATRERSAP
jgi:hypothetical protein